VAQAPPQGPPGGPLPPPPWPPPGALPPPPPYGGYGGPQFWAPPPPGPAPGLAYAGFWIRVAAYVIDGIIIDVPLALIALPIIGAAGPVSCTYRDLSGGREIICSNLGSLIGDLGFLWLLFLLVPLAYFTALWAWQGQSLGQRALGLHVVDANTGVRISFGRALLRYVGIVIGMWVLFIGVIWVAFDPRKQGWHDKMASTFVVKRI